MKTQFILLILLCCIPGLSQPLQGKLETLQTLTAGESVAIADLLITLKSVNDDGCGRVIECYWIAYKDATFQVQHADTSYEITLSRASREDSQLFIQIGNYYLILEDALGYDMEKPVATFQLSSVKPAP